MQGFNLRLERIRNHPITLLLQTSNSISKLSVFWWFQSTWTWEHFAFAYAGLRWKQLLGSSISIAIALSGLLNFRAIEFGSSMYKRCNCSCCYSKCYCILQNLHIIEFCTIWVAIFERQKHELNLFSTKTRCMGVVSWSPNSTVIHLDIYSIQI